MAWCTVTFITRNNSGLYVYTKWHNTINPLKKKRRLLYSYRAVNTFHLGYKNQSVYAVSGTNRCLFSDKYRTQKYSVGRTNSCWMLNCWCITWPVDFKRLITLSKLLSNCTGSVGCITPSNAWAMWVSTSIFVFEIFCTSIRAAHLYKFYYLPSFQIPKANNTSVARNARVRGYDVMSTNRKAAESDNTSDFIFIYYL